MSAHVLVRRSWLAGGWKWWCIDETCTGYSWVTWHDTHAEALAAACEHVRRAIEPHRGQR